MIAILFSPLRRPWHWVSWEDRWNWMGDRAEIRGADADTDTVLELEVSAMSMIQSAIVGVDGLPSTIP